MLIKFSGSQELDRVSMLIRALSEEMAEQRILDAERASTNAVSPEMEEALYELRVRKLVLSIFVSSDQIADRTTRH